MTNKKTILKNILLTTAISLSAAEVMAAAGAGVNIEADDAELANAAAELLDAPVVELLNAAAGGANAQGRLANENPFFRNELLIAAADRFLGNRQQDANGDNAHVYPFLRIPAGVEAQAGGVEAQAAVQEEEEEAMDFDLFDNNAAEQAGAVAVVAPAAGQAGAVAAVDAAPYNTGIELIRNIHHNDRDAIYENIHAIIDDVARGNHQAEDILRGILDNANRDTANLITAAAAAGGDVNNPAVAALHQGWPDDLDENTLARLNAFAGPNPVLAQQAQNEQADANAPAARLANEQAFARLANEQAEAARLANEQAEAARLANEQAEAARLADVQEAVRRANERFAAVVRRANERFANRHNVEEGELDANQQDAVRHAIAAAEGVLNGNQDAIETVRNFINNNVMMNENERADARANLNRVIAGDAEAIAEFRDEIAGIIDGLNAPVAAADAARKAQIDKKMARDSDNSKEALNLAFGQTATRLGALVSPIAETASAEGIAAGSGTEKFGVWGQAMGGIANQKTRKGTTGFRSTSIGGMIGVDTMINDNTIIGLALGDVVSNVKHKDGDKTKSSSLVASAYGNYKFDNDFFIRGAAAYSNTAVDNKDKRVNAAQVTGVARSKYHINSFGGEVAVGKIFTLPNDVLVTPSIGARFTRTGKISYKEKGGAGFDYPVLQKASNSAMGIVGLQVAKAFAVNDFTITPELHANVAYGLGVKTPSGKYTNTIADEKISYRGDKPSRFDSTVGFGITAESSSFEYGVAYDANIAAGYLGHQGAVKLKVKF